MDALEQRDAAGPYAEAAQTYWRAGWRGVLPLPCNAKTPPPPGYTGASGVWPSYADVYAWCEGNEGSGNIALRLPPHTLGLDVDDYAGKRGAATLDECERRMGELPPTWVGGSREGRSGIRFYRVPEGLAWPGQLPGGDVELIQTRHRYAVVAPSLHPNGARYRWVNPHGVASTVPPNVDDLPMLPSSWVDALTRRELATDVLRNTLGYGDVVSWLVEHGSGEPCMRIDAARERSLLDLGYGSRHDAALQATMRLVRLAHEHHPGALAALSDVHAAWLLACADSSRGTARTSEQADREWHSMLVGAVNVVTAEPPSSLTSDPCIDPLTDLLTEAQLTALKEAQTWPHTVSAGSTDSPSSSASSAAASASRIDARIDEQRADVTLTRGSESASSATHDAASDAERSSDELALEQRRAELRAQLVAHELERQRAQREARRQLDAEDAAQTFREPVWRRTLTAELAMPDEAVNYRVDELMPTHANVLLTAAFKAGKTTLVNALTRSLVDGETFLGRFGVSSDVGRVALFNYEVGEAQYRRWLRELSVRNTDAVTVLNLRGMRLPLASSYVEDWVVRFLVEHEISVWVVDPFARAFTGSGDSENDNTAVGSFLDTLDVIKHRAGVRELILPTHTGRAVQERGAERARGATRLDDWADVRWLLTRDADGSRWLRASGRDVEVDEGALIYDELTRSLSFEQRARESESNGQLVDAVLRAVNVEHGITARGLKLLTGASRDKLAQAVNALESQGAIRVDRSDRANGHKHWPIALAPHRRSSD